MRDLRAHTKNRDEWFSVGIMQYICQGCSAHDCSPILVFCFCYPKYRRLQKSDKMRLNVCVNEMAGRLQLSSRFVSPLTVVAQKEVCPRDDMANPPGIKVFTVERDGFR